MKTTSKPSIKTYIVILKQWFQIGTINNGGGDVHLIEYGQFIFLADIIFQNLDIMNTGYRCFSIADSFNVVSEGRERERENLIMSCLLDYIIR